jgi:hypothetical protein
VFNWLLLSIQYNIVNYKTSQSVGGLPFARIWPLKEQHRQVLILARYSLFLSPYTWWLFAYSIDFVYKTFYSPWKFENGCKVSLNSCFNQIYSLHILSDRLSETRNNRFFCFLSVCNSNYTFSFISLLSLEFRCENMLPLSEMPGSGVCGYMIEINGSHSG